MKKVDRLLEYYNLKKREIRGRLDDFRKVWRKSDGHIFAELCFCICTPRSRAKRCDRAIAYLMDSGLLLNGSVHDLRANLGGVRFPNNKSRYIIDARTLFMKNGKIRLKERLNIDDIKATRDWLVKGVKGLGYKEASHFLRNIGFGSDLAILDVHILRNLKKYGIIEVIPRSLPRLRYLAIEEQMRKFAKEIGIPLAELDLLFWSQATGEVFK